MKKIFVLLLLTFGLLNAATVTETIEGSIINKYQNGKDGAVWNFLTKNNLIIKVLVSIPNLGEEESKKMDYIKSGAMLKLKGEVLVLDNRKRLIVKKIDLLK